MPLPLVVGGGGLLTAAKGLGLGLGKTALEGLVLYGAFEGIDELLGLGLTGGEGSAQGAADDATSFLGTEEVTNLLTQQRGAESVGRLADFAESSARDTALIREITRESSELGSLLGVLQDEEATLGAISQPIDIDTRAYARALGVEV